ncbi:unnamed protein product [Urochloa humidicola]
MEIGMIGKREQEVLLLRAAYDGNLRLLKKMARALDEGQGEAAVLAGTADGDGFTAMHMAAVAGRADLLQYMVEELRLDVNPRNCRGETPLFLSAFFGRLAATTYLLDHGGDPISRSILGFALDVAVGRGHCEIVELLLPRGNGASLASLCGILLHTAALHGQAGTMKTLLEHHANPNEVTNSGTALNNAIYSKSLECVKLLIEAGADVNFIDSAGLTYIMVAMDCGTPEILKCLLDSGANPNIPCESGRTPIEVAAVRGTREIVEMLFPLTSPVSTIPDWSIDGIISHMNAIASKQMDKDLCKKQRISLKLQGADAFKKKEFSLAVQLYSNAMELGPIDAEHATLLANRSICWLRLEDGDRALADATACRKMRPDWPKACYRQGAAFMLLKEYEKACEAFADGSKLNPTNVEIKDALRECLEAMKNVRCTGKAVTASKRSITGGD